MVGKIIHVFNVGSIGVCGAMPGQLLGLCRWDGRKGTKLFCLCGLWVFGVFGAVELIDESE